MTVDEACDVLGIRIGASIEEIKAAYYDERAKCDNPDPHAEGADNPERFRRVQAAYEILCPRGGLERDDWATGPADDTAEERVPDPVRIVRTFLEELDIEILSDGALRKRSAPRMAMTRADIEACISIEPIDAQWLIDTILLDIRSRKIKLRKSDLERALRRVIGEKQQERRKAIIKPLLAEFSPLDLVRADEEWDRLIRTVFTTDPILATAVLKHFIWQVKQKLVLRPVYHHLTPVVVSPEQGSGKSTFVRGFLDPLKELAVSLVRLSDFTDKRSRDIYGFPVLFIDDMEKIDPRQIPVLKSLVTGEGFRQRGLGTSTSTTILQRTTLIGTANTGIDELVTDETGNRRFATLAFRNGEVATGGDPRVWEVVDRADYDFLWRSIDVLGPCPIEDCLGDLYRLQAASRRPGDLAAWLMSLDVGSDAMRRITTKDGVKAGALWDLFREETGNPMSITRFGMEMARLAADPEVPFDRKVKTMSGTFYPLKTSGS